MKDLFVMQKSIEAIASDAYHLIYMTPDKMRPKGAEKNGVVVLVRYPDDDQKIIFGVRYPGDESYFYAIEQAIRMETLGHSSSVNSVDFRKGKRAGCLAIKKQGKTVQVSVHGLEPAENVHLAATILAFVAEISPAQVCREVRENGGELPEEFFIEKHYLFKFEQCC